MKTFAAIDVGSYEIAMKIFQMAPKGAMKEIDHIRHKIDLGSETYNTGKLSAAKVDELVRILSEYMHILKGYKVDDYKVYGTSAIREMANTAIILGQIKHRTGIRVDVLSNSEQRFLDYKSIASKGDAFDRIIEKGTVIVDIGGGSVQISLFDKDVLVSTQNLRIGVLRIQESLKHLNALPSKTEMLIEEMVASQVAVFQKLYLKERQIDNIIVVDDYLTGWMRNQNFGTDKQGYVDEASYMEFMDKLRRTNAAEGYKEFGVSQDTTGLFFASAVMVKCMMKMLGAKQLWAPGVSLCDGIAYEYAEKEKLFKGGHDFEKDILACARSISKRYMGSKKRAEILENLTLSIFDSTKKYHGLGKRERLYLQIAAILSDCGKYISLANLGECAYNIIMSTEIIGLSHMEREIVADIVKFNHDEFVYFEELSKDSSLDREAYLVMAKLTAILRVAHGLDRSHKQKFKNVKIAVKDGNLVFTVETSADITLERGMFGYKAAFFEEVYNLRPIIKQKNSY